MTRAVDHPPALTEERAAEDMLHAVRRADWRFLLPNPQLDDVAYVAPHDPELGAALERVARSVVLLDGRDDAGGSHDVVVATRASAGSAPALAALTRPGGGSTSRPPAARARGGRARCDARGSRRSRWSGCGRTRPRPRDGPAPRRAAVRHALGRRDPGARLRARAWAARALLAATRCRSPCPPPPWSGAGPSSSGDAS